MSVRHAPNPLSLAAFVDRSGNLRMRDYQVPTRLENIHYDDLRPHTDAVNVNSVRVGVDDEKACQGGLMYHGATSAPNVSRS